MADGSISEGDYMKKLEAFVQQVVQRAKGGDYRAKLNSFLSFGAASSCRGKQEKANHEKEENDEGVK